MQVGEIKKGKLQHLSERKFGFIRVAVDGVLTDRFFHTSSVLSGNPVVGCEVEFSEGFARGRTCAVNVRFLAPEPVSAAAAELLSQKILEETLIVAGVK